MKKMHCACGDRRVADDDGTARQALAHRWQIRAAFAGLALAALLAGAVGIAFAPIFVRTSEVGPVALASHVLGQSLVAYALAGLPAAFSSVALLLQPTIAAGLA